jgi:trans-aconitate methyltransferase
MTDAWKDDRLPEKQLALNRKELAGPYPDHWTAMLACVRQVPSGLYFYDIGCGVGSTAQLLRQEGISLRYLGLDFSEAMIRTASDAWPFAEFVCEDYRTTTRSFTDGVLYCTGLLDILPDGVAGLRQLLSFGSPYVLLNRVQLGPKEHVRVYKAYDLIDCYSYTFATATFAETIRTAGYTPLRQHGSCFLLQKTQ